jgi:starvation-inducible DNA-binding protein
VVEQSDLQPVEHGPTPVADVIRQLSNRLAQVDERVRERAERLAEIDLASQDVLIEVIRALEKQLWMVRSQL